LQCSEIFAFNCELQLEIVFTEGVFQMANDLPKCISHDDLVRFDRPLFHLAKQLKSRTPVKIVAIGSSSTEGEGVPPYPGRLQEALRLRFPTRRIDVVNQGKGGEEAPAELARFDQDVIGEAPALAIWQVGTNAIFHKYVLDDVAAAIDAGLRRLSGLPMDVVLIDLQFAPIILGPKTADTERMVKLIAEAANNAGVNVFRRFALMRKWKEDDKIPLDLLIGSDGLHQTEWSTNCVTQALEASIAEAVSRGSPDPLLG
jgi:hypothetical protein